MTAREELAQSIATNLDLVFPGTREFGPATQDYVLADALLAEGWGKRRTVATVEELDALPHRTVVLDAAGDVWRQDSIGTYNNTTWWDKLDDEECQTEHSDRLALPATVLHEPQS